MSASAAPLVPPARYQIVPAEVTGSHGETEKVVLLLDSSNGDVWEYQPGFVMTEAVDGKKKWIPAVFSPVAKQDPAAQQTQ